MFNITSHETSGQFKTCRRCGKTKELTAFWRDSSRKDGHDNYCKSCRTSLARERYNANPEEARRRRKANRDLNRDKDKQADKLIREIVREMAKMSGCIITGGTTNLAYHHLDPITKRFKLSHAYKYSWDSIFAELEKCLVVSKSEHGRIHKALEGKFINNPSPEFNAFMLKHYGMSPQYIGDKAVYVKVPELQLPDPIEHCDYVKTA